MVEYFSVLDPTTLQANFSQNLLTMLVHIYKILTKSSFHHPSYKMSPTNAFFLNVNLGWLFENPLIPRELFFDDELKSIAVIDQILSDKIVGDFQDFLRSTLDENDVLTVDVIQSMNLCLSEIRVVLGQFISGKKVNKQTYLII